MKILQIFLDKSQILKKRINNTLAKVYSLKYLHKFGPLVLLTLTPLVIFREIIFTKTSSFFITYDNVQQFYAWYQKLSTSIHQGYLPIWDANVFGGHSFVGEFQAGAFYPINILWVILFGNADGIDIYYLELLVILHFFIASLGMYLVGRKFGLSKIASFISAVVFAYLGTTAARATAQTAIFFGLTYLPLALYFTAKYYDKQKIRYVFFSGVIMGLQILAGHIQPFFHTALLSLLYISYLQIQKTDVRKFKSICTNTINIIKISGIQNLVALIIASPQIYLGLQYLSNVYRWVGAPFPIGPGEKVPYKTFAYESIFQPEGIFNILDRNKFPISDGNLIFLGFVPAALLIFFILNYKKYNIITPFKNLGIFLSGLITLTFLIIIGHNTFFTAILYVVPLVNQVREPGRYVILIHFALSLLIGIAVMGLQRINFKFSAKPKTLSYVFLGFIILQTFYMTFLTRTAAKPETIYQYLLLSIICLGIIAFANYKNILALCIFICILSSIYVTRSIIFTKINNHPDYPLNYFARNEIIDYLEPYFGEYRVMVMELELPKNVGDVYKIQTKMGHGASIYKPYFDFISEGWSLDSKVHDLLNIRFIVSEKPIENFKLILQDTKTGYYLYERNTVYPRLYGMNMIENNSNSVDKFQTINYTDHYIKYEISMKFEDEVIFSEVNYPGWNAKIDGKDVDIQTPHIINLPNLFRSLTLETGNHTVEFEYKPFKFI